MHDASHMEIVEAFADGEAVDPATLILALSSPVGRAHLVDVLVLRELVSRDGRMSARPAVASKRTAPTRLRRVAIAASLAFVAAVGGYGWGLRSASPGTSPQAPSITPAAPYVAAPEPTRVIKLEPGVNWNERLGG